MNVNTIRIDILRSDLESLQFKAVHFDDLGSHVLHIIRKLAHHIKI